MRLLLRRDIKSSVSTIGKLYVDGAFTCFILEDQDRGLIQGMPLAEIQQKKVHGKTAIPEGEYDVTATLSNRFKRRLPLLLNVPGFEGIRIHSGNTAADTEGCLITGSGMAIDKVENSRIAFNKLFDLIDTAFIKHERVTIKIESLK